MGKVKRRVAEPAAPLSFEELRERLALTRSDFGRLLGFSERALASWEAGRQEPGEPAVRALRQLERLTLAAGRVMRAGQVPDWLLAPNQALGGLKPVEIIERGEIDRLWRALFAAESGAPI
jgi:transcriptional regulator with XRE-family HTH domain